MLIQFRNILERATTGSDDAFITLAMGPIYHEAAQIKGGRGAPRRRAEFIESRVTKRSGIWLKVHDSIEASFDTLFQETEQAMVQKFGEVFDSLHANFRLLCTKTEVKDEKEKVLEQALRAELKDHLKEVKGMLGDGGNIPRLVAECKAYSAQASTSPLFLPQ